MAADWLLLRVQSWQREAAHEWKIPLKGTPVVIFKLSEKCERYWLKKARKCVFIRCSLHTCIIHSVCRYFTPDFIYIYIFFKYIFCCFIDFPRPCGGPDAAPHHPRRVAVGAAGHSEDRLVHQQQRRGEVPSAGAGEQGAAEDHPGGEAFYTHTWYRDASLAVRKKPATIFYLDTWWYVFIFTYINIKCKGFFLSDLIVSQTQSVIRLQHGKSWDLEPHEYYSVEDKGTRVHLVVVSFNYGLFYGVDGTLFPWLLQHWQMWRRPS